tara:strand:- start:4520 stop:5140 length:621 start_codon:yes stop_codon:yes gene_type:complete
MKLKKFYEAKIYPKIIKESNLSSEQKQAFIEAVSKFNEYGKSIYRENKIKEVVGAINKLSEGAGNYIMSETEDWFDGVTVKRDVKEINNTSKLFEKTALEMEAIQQRLESLYEDLGGKLGRYYELKEDEDYIDDKEAATDYDDLKDKDVDNDGDTDDADEYLKHKLGVIAKKTEGISPKVGGPAGQRWGIATGKKANSNSTIWRKW